MAKCRAAAAKLDDSTTLANTAIPTKRSKCKPLKANSRVRITLTRKGQSVQALGVIRIVKPRIGMGVEFIDVDEKHNLALTRWLDQLRREY